MGQRVSSRLRAVTAVAVTATGVLVSAPATLAGPAASAARSAYISETGHLHLTSSRGLKLNEQGSASGSIKGRIYIHLTVSSQHGVSAEVSIYPSGGSLTGYGQAGYRVNGGVAEFSGSLSIARGTGNYAHAHAHNLRFTGTIRRSDDAVNVKLSGTLFY